MQKDIGQGPETGQLVPELFLLSPGLSYISHLPWLLDAAVLLSFGQWHVGRRESHNFLVQ